MNRNEPSELIEMASAMILTGWIYHIFPSLLTQFMMHLCFFLGTSVFFMICIREVMTEYIDYHEE